MYKKIKLAVATFIILIFISIPVALASPCDGDPNCYSPGTTTFPNQVHYVFIGAHPDDELHIYPLMKDFCGKSTSYCAMMIGSTGETACEVNTGAQCAAERTAELHASAIYLRSDVWQYNLTNVSPGADLQDVRNTFNQEAAASGYGDMVNFFKQKLAQFKTPSSTLYVITFDPVHGSTGHSAHRVIGEFVSTAINSMNSGGMVATKLLIDTYRYIATNDFPYTGRPFLASFGDPNAICRNGSNHLIVSNTNLTNFDVLDYGFNIVYQGQKYHTPDGNYDVPSAYEFCYK